MCGGKNRVASGWGLARRDTRRTNGIAATHDALLLRVLPVHRVPSLKVITQAFLWLVGRSALFGLLSWFCYWPSCTFLQHWFFLLIILHSLHLVPVSVLLQMTLPTSTGAKAKSQVISFLCPHVLATLLFVPAPGPANAIELDKNAAFPLVEALKVHPSAVWTMLIVAYNFLVVILLQVHWPSKATDQWSSTRGFCGRQNRHINNSIACLLHYLFKDHGKYTRGLAHDLSHQSAHKHQLWARAKSSLCQEHWSTSKEIRKWRKKETKSHYSLFNIQNQSTSEALPLCCKALRSKEKALRMFLEGCFEAWEATCGEHTDICLKNKQAIQPGSAITGRGRNLSFL